MTATRVNITGIHELDFTLAGPTSAAITAPGVVTLTETISGAAGEFFATPSGGSGLASLRPIVASDLTFPANATLASFGEQTAVTSNGMSGTGTFPQTILSWPIYHAIMTAGRGFEVTFSTQQTGGAGTTGQNQFRVLWGNGSITAWPVVASSNPVVFGKVSIYNIPYSTNNQTVVLHPLMVQGATASTLTTGVTTAASENTTTDLPLSIQYQGDAGQTVRVFQAAITLI